MDFRQAKMAQSSDKFRNIYLDNGQIGATSQELISLWPNDADSGTVAGAGGHQIINELRGYDLQVPAQLSQQATVGGVHQMAEDSR